MKNAKKIGLTQKIKSVQEPGSRKAFPCGEEKNILRRGKRRNSEMFGPKCEKMCKEETCKAARGSSDWKSQPSKMGGKVRRRAASKSVLENRKNGQSGGGGSALSSKRKEERALRKKERSKFGRKKKSWQRRFTSIKKGKRVICQNGKGRERE